VIQKLRVSNSGSVPSENPFVSATRQQKKTIRPARFSVFMQVSGMRVDEMRDPAVGKNQDMQRVARTAVFWVGREPGDGADVRGVCVQSTPPALDVEIPGY
jgi:hypothetical protein